tara:strand:- start:759 stop:1184 length:426 start_codon:yes stop_codon:yes gene_type:complete
MGFKLGSEIGNQTTSGEIRKKMQFGRKAGGDASIPGVPVIRKDLGKGIRGEANMDGTIFLSNELEPGSAEEREVLMHEVRHITDMRIGKLVYEDDYVQWNGNTYKRQDIEGKDMIKFEGNWIQAGSTELPWELEANNGNEH